MSPTVVAQGPDGLWAKAWQKSWIEAFAIHGEAYTAVRTDAPGQHGGATSSIAVGFTVPVDAAFYFKAKFAFTRENLDFGSDAFAAQAAFFGTSTGDGHCQGFHIWEDAEPWDTAVIWEIECIGTVLAEQNALFVLNVASAHGDGAEGRTEAGVEFDLNFGDRDHDGLLDIWEEEGIDLGELGSIPLHAMGTEEDTADPDIKDIYVEIDTMAGAPYSQGDLDKVKEAFKKAPVAGSDQEPGLPGIRLHLIHDETVPAQPFVGWLSSTYAFLDIRRAHFGSPGDSEALREAKKAVFRYALIVNHMVEDNGKPGYGFGEFVGAPSTGPSPLVIGGPGHGLWVAAGSVKSATMGGCGPFPCMKGFEESLSGAFMHGLGHTLGLAHGGQEIAVNNKPNYLSVMNGAYHFPWNKLTLQGTFVYQSWRLDYSRERLPLLDEAELSEENGLLSATGREIFWSGRLGVIDVRAIDKADGEPIDWNLEGGISQDPVTSDLNREPGLSAGPGTILSGYSDWQQLSYRPELVWFDFGTSPPSLGGGEPGWPPFDEIDLADIEAYLAEEWIDLTDVVDADLRVTKTNDETEVVGGEATTYIVTVENDGPSNVLQAIVSDHPPKELSCSWTCTASIGASCTTGPVEGDLDDSIDLPLGGIATYTVECLVDSEAIGPISNVATVTPPPSVADLDPLDNEAVDTDSVAGSCGHPNGLVLEQQVIDTTVEVIACSLVKLGDQLQVIGPGQLIVRTAGRVEIHSGFQVGAGGELQIGDLSPP